MEITLHTLIQISYNNEKVVVLPFNRTKTMRHKMKTKFELSLTLHLSKIDVSIFNRELFWFLLHEKSFLLFIYFLLFLSVLQFLLCSTFHISVNGSR